MQQFGMQSGYRQPKESQKNNPCQICRRNNQSALSCFYRWDYFYQAQQEVPQALEATTLSDQHDNHMVNSPGILTNSSPLRGNGDKLPITHIGDKNIEKNLHLKDIFVVPELRKNLISVSKLVTDNPCSLDFIDRGFIVKDKRM